MFTRLIPHDNNGAQVQLLFRPLKDIDVDPLTNFLENLSSESKRFSVYPGYDRSTAQQFCSGISRNDRIRFVLINPLPESGFSYRIVGLFFLKFGVSEPYIERFKRAVGIELDSETTVCIGPTLADEYQGKGLGSLVLKILLDLAKKLGKRRVILYGGVMEDNVRAIRFYEKHGFKKIGCFMGKNGQKSLDMMLDLGLEGEPFLSERIFIIIEIFFSEIFLYHL